MDGFKGGINGHGVLGSDLGCLIRVWYNTWRLDLKIGFEGRIWRLDLKFGLESISCEILRLNWLGLGSRVVLKGTI